MLCSASPKDPFGEAYAKGTSQPDRWLAGAFPREPFGLAEMHRSLLIGVDHLTNLLQNIVGQIRLLNEVF